MDAHQFGAQLWLTTMLNSSLFLFPAEEKESLSKKLYPELWGIVAEYLPFHTRVVLAVVCPCTREGAVIAEEKTYKCVIANHNANWHFALHIKSGVLMQLVTDNSTVADAQPFCVSLAHGLFRWKPLPPLSAAVAINRITLNEAWNRYISDVIFDVDLSGNNVLAVGCDDGIYFLNAANGDYLRGGQRLEEMGRGVFIDGMTMAAFRYLSFAADLDLCTVHSDGILTDSRTIRNVPDFYKWDIGSLKLSPATDKLYVLKKFNGRTPVVWVFSTLDWTLSNTLRIEGGNVVGLFDVSCDGKLLAIGVLNKETDTYDIDVVDTTSGRVLRTLIPCIGSRPNVPPEYACLGSYGNRSKFPTTAIAQVVFSPDMDFLVSVNGRNAQLFEVKTGQLVGRPRYHGDDTDALCNVLWINAEVFVTSSEKATLCVWHIGSEKPVTVVKEAHEYRINCVVRVSDNSFVTGCGYGVLKKWEVVQN